MIDRLAELNRVLNVVSQLTASGEELARSVLIEACQRAVFEGQWPNHEATILCAAEMGFMRVAAESCVLTANGKEFLSLNPKGELELSDDQRKVLVRSQYLGGGYRRSCKKLFDSFAISAEDDAIRWTATDGKPLRVEPWIVEHLCELGALIRGEGLLEVHPDYTRVVAAFIEESLGMTEERLREILKEKEEVGTLAEQLILDYEKKRLLTAGFAIESRCVSRVSKLRVNLGYDIESFDGSAKDLVYDRLIEVKGAKGQDIRFFWSDNEIKVAEKLKNRYWIYFQGGVDPKAGVARNEPLCFQNPIISIRADVRLTKSAQGIMVEGKMRGSQK